MAKYPTPGRVKTRLAAAVGPDAAAALARAFVVDLAARLAGTGQPVVWAVTPPDAPFATLLPGARAIGQRGADLGARMAAATADLFAEDPAPVIVLGTDTPHVRLDALDAAGAALATGTDVVLGPAEDGGYWLLGLRTPVPDLFTGVAWGGDTVFRTTADRARALGLATRLVAPAFDVDDVDALRRLGALLAAGRVILPETARVLRAFPTLA
jgi:rSAM/selenodomain-associated transferase 1